MNTSSEGGVARRFYDAANVVEADGGWSIELDARPVRTPSGNLLEVPVRALAQAMADEWNAQGDKVDPHSMPLCGIANASIDRVALDRALFIGQLGAYARADLICYRSDADAPADLLQQQHTTWQPLLDWAHETLGVALVSTSGIVHVAQPAEAIAAVERAVSELDAFRLAAITDLATGLGSVIIALAVFHGHLTPDQGFDAAHVDEHYQIEKWGEDKEAVDRLTRLRADVATSARFLLLLMEKDVA